MNWTPEQVENLIFDRRKIYDLMKVAVESFEPRRFHFILENINNVRNIMIVCGALATITLMILPEIKNFVIIALLVLSLISFLISIIAYAFFLKYSIELNINFYSEELQSRLDKLKEGEVIINDALDGKIKSYGEYEEKIKKFWLSLEKEYIRGERQFYKNPDLEKKIQISGKIGNLCFMAAIIALIIAMLVYIFFILANFNINNLLKILKYNHAQNN